MPHNAIIWSIRYGIDCQQYILIQQMKFIKRIQSNEYLKEFLVESRNIKNNSGLIGRFD